jgi:hypothetical protein
MVYSLFNAAFLEPTDFSSGIVNNTATPNYVPANGILLSGLIAQSTAGGTTWTNATENVDANYSGNTWHTSASFTTVAEVSAQSVTALEAGTVTDLCRMQVTFQPVNGKPFISTRAAYTINASAQTTYTFLNCAVGAPSSSRRVFIHTMGYASSRSLTSVTINGVAATVVLKTTGNVPVPSGLYVADVALGTTVNVVVTFSAGVSGAGIQFFAAYGLSSSIAYSSAASTLISPNTTTIDVPQDGFILSVSASTRDASGESITFGNVTEFQEAYTGGKYMALAFTNRMAAQTGRILTSQWTHLNNNYTFSASYL